MSRVSIVIPTWNRTQLLRDALLSVIAQTEGDFEAFIVDDGSEHGMAQAIVAELGDTRLRYIRGETHRGVGAARNLGIASATAPYVAFLDDDDQWLPEKLSVQLRHLESSPASVGGVYSARYTIDRQAATVSVQRFRKPFSAWHGSVITTSSVLVRRCCFDLVGLFDERLTAGGDWDMWLRIAARYELEYIDEVLVKYTQHQNSISGDALRHAPARELILRKHADLFAQHRRSYSGRYRRLGMLYHEHGQPGKARRALWKAVRIWPLAARAYWGLCRSYLASRERRSPRPLVTRGDLEVL